MVNDLFDLIEREYAGEYGTANAELRACKINGFIAGGRALHRQMQVLVGVFVAGIVEQSHVGQDQRIHTEVYGSIYGITPDIYTVGLRKGVDRQKDFALMVVCVAYTRYQAGVVKIQSGKITRIRGIFKPDIDRIGTVVYGGFECGQAARRADKLWNWRIDAHVDILSRIMMSETCYHCGLDIPPATAFSAVVSGERRLLCCAGCQAVVEAIVAGGLESYYQQRDALPESPRYALPPALAELGLFDLPEVQRNFACAVGEHEQEASLMIEGITCAACVWLVESHIGRLAGVRAIHVNYVTRRARVRWDTRETQLSTILAATVTIGYRAHPYDAAKSEQLATQERRSALWRLFVAGFGMMQVMMYAVPAYLAGEGDMTAHIEQLMRWASLILTVPVIAYSALPFFTSAWKDIARGRLGMDVPVALGVGLAFVASCWATWTGSGQVYFDSVTMFVFLLLGGRYLEMMARQRSVRGVESVSRALPAFAQRYEHWPQPTLEKVAVARLSPGDVVCVKPGEIIPADGQVLEGTSSVDESLLTGESRPIEKRANDLLIGGSINRGSPLVMRVCQVGEQTRLAAIVRLMERASSEKPRLVEMADRVAAYFVLGLLALACVTWWYWSTSAPDQALWIFVAVLVVSCPCALSLATPVALTVTTGVLARMGVLVTRGHAIETLARVSDFVFDKTGTLTQGRPQLVGWKTLNEQIDRHDALILAAGLERASEHPLALAFAQATPDFDLPAIEAISAHTGEGLSGRWQGQCLRLGKWSYAAPGLPEPQDLHEGHTPDQTILTLSIDGVPCALFGLADPLRAHAFAALASLQQDGAMVRMWSGDAAPVVQQLATQLRVSAYQAALSPEDKHRLIGQLQQQGRLVAMVGDGVNDAPVLAQAQVSIAMASGADLAKSHADIVLLNGDLRSLSHAVGMCRRTLRIIRQNLFWAVAYNVAAIPLAMSGHVTPWLAGIGMSASSLFVILNALRLQKGAR
jgi:Cu2+-exporting ATPase